MPINADKPHLWKTDVERSIDFYNDWFIRFAPETKKARTTRESPGEFIAADHQAQEDNRTDAQNLTDASKSAEERNRLGQFSTPFPVACQIVARALKALPPESSIAFLEPALGTGVFFSALLRNTRPARISSATGCEIDPAYGDTQRLNSTSAFVATAIECLNWCKP